MTISFYYQNRQHAVDLAMLKHNPTRKSYETVFHAGWQCHKATMEMEEQEIRKKQRVALLGMLTVSMLLGVTIGLML